MKNNLEKIIGQKGINKSWLAEQAGINRNTVTSLIRGSVPKLNMAYKIAKILGLTVYDIWPPG